MVSLQSYKDMQKEDVFSWADLNFSTLYKIIDARAVDYEKFKSLVIALDCCLYFFSEKDAQYMSEMNVLDCDLIKLKEELQPHELDVYKWDMKFKILSSLVGRVNMGKIKISEFTEHSKILQDISNKLNQGIGQNVFTTGMPGSGKSESMVKIAQQICDLTGATFDIDKHICTSPAGFAELYNDIELCPPGSCIIFDEAGVEFNARDFQSENNKIFSKLLQIIRHRAICVMFTAPDLSFIDSQGRKVLHWWFETTKLYKNIGVCYIKPHVVDVIQATGKILYPFPIYDDQQINLIKVRALKSSHRTQYKNFSKRFKDKMAIEAQISFSVNKPKKKEEIEYVQLREKNITQKEIMNKYLKMSQSKASRLENVYKNYKNSK